MEILGVEKYLGMKRLGFGASPQAVKLVREILRVRGEHGVNFLAEEELLLRKSMTGALGSRERAKGTLHVHERGVESIGGFWDYYWHVCHLQNDVGYPNGNNRDSNTDVGTFTDTTYPKHPSEAMFHIFFGYGQGSPRVKDLVGKILCVDPVASLAYLELDISMVGRTIDEARSLQAVTDYGSYLFSLLDVVEPLVPLGKERHFHQT